MQCEVGASVPRAGAEVRLFDSVWAFVLLVLYIYYTYACRLRGLVNCGAFDQAADLRWFD
jgi:hypothetical protein